MSIATDVSPDQRTKATALIAEWAAERPEGLMPRKQVIDRLLDLRNLLSGPDLIGVDSILVDIPGVTVVESAWWIDQVDWLQRFASTQLRTSEGQS